jgi:uncharacterized protein YjbI with pentapeptide repeats
MEAAGDPFALLPAPLVAIILARLPVDSRLRCAEVCRAWRAALTDERLWAVLDFAGVSRVSDALLRAAGARAGSSLRALDVSRCDDVTHAALLEVAAASAALLELRVCHGFEDALRSEAVVAALRAAPRLRALTTDAHVTVPVAHTMLRNAAPFASLALRRLRVTFTQGGDAAVLSLVDAVAAHASLRGLMLTYAPLDAPALLDAVADAALARRLTHLGLEECSLQPACAPVLARLLGGDALRELFISSGFARQQLLDEPAAALLGAALRANATLTSLRLTNVGLWRDAAAGAALLRACGSHASLMRVDLSHNHVPIEQREFAGAALAALLAANAPALEEVRVTECWLGDPGLAPLVEALPQNTHVRTLHCEDNRMTDAFGRAQLLPAVRANRGLRRLVVASQHDQVQSTREAEALVSARAA